MKATRVMYNGWECNKVSLWLDEEQAIEDARRQDLDLVLCLHTTQKRRYQ